ncbi:MAG: bifunctional UDP-N-acetylmuramoyl-tripeptide:D-alanyl-D-alanine ligase/alanine racemase [Flavobacteriales bacterium]|nr:bifunctional UDP-N-acetylmuramoyl-tripeptide:D-alanyl-D-alanine ligase/alanine racemase [Flavobacteriales bacterium]
MSAMRPTLRTLAEVTGGTLTGTGDVRIEHLLIDSRNAAIGDNTLFIALVGPRHDGHRYLQHLYARGLRNFLVSAPVDAAAMPGANIVRVPDTLKALQAIASWHRSRFHIPVIGITGSNGKTIVKEWLFQMLRGEERIVRSPGSWNSQVGVPLSAWQLGPEHTLGIFEAGISRPGEMAALEAIIRPTIGVFTHLGSAHDEGFGHLGSDAKAIEKSKLFARADVWIHPNDRSEIDKLHHLLPGVEPKEWSMIGHGRAGDFLHVIAHEVIGDATHIRTLHNNAEHDYVIPFTDQASLENALSCICVCLHLGRSTAWINERLALLEPVDMRLRTMQGRHGTTLIDDSYSNDQSSLAVALEHQERIAHGRPRAIVLSDMAESGLPDERLYREVAATLARAGIAQVIGVGPAIGAQQAVFPSGTRFHADTDALLASEDLGDLAGAVVLVKGARSFGFERVVERWQQHVHGTELQVDLEAVRHNLNHYRGLLNGNGEAPPQPSPKERENPKGTRVMAMVKAFGYGSGAVELARLLQHEQVHYLGVAYADEGIELRQHGITTPILVMNPEPVAMETLHRFELEPEVYDMASLQAVVDHASKAGSAPAVHIKLDTGMHRLGFQEAELPALLDALRGVPVRVASILSHLAASEDPQHDAFTRAQIGRFTMMSNGIIDVLGYHPMLHIANSSAIARFPEARFDMVRVGIGLHGIGCSPEETAQLLPVATLRTVVAQVKDIAAGDSIGYGRRAMEDRQRRIAILPIGYADGFLRRLGNGVGRVRINGCEARTVGNICMDMCMVDVTNIPCNTGDEAIVFGAAPTLQQYAEDLGTIPYEALTSIAQRVKRVYVRG